MKKQRVKRKKKKLRLNYKRVFKVLLVLTGIILVIVYFCNLHIKRIKISGTKLISDKEHCYSKAYDIVINGYEAGGGSIRIHKEEVQEKMFRALELSEEDIKNKFGFFVEALKYGTPPHGGLALGLDRLTMLLSGTDNIREVIAFPKTASASCLMSECPNSVSDKQLDELGIIAK